jgi:hypothetical protein
MIWMTAASADEWGGWSIVLTLAIKFRLSAAAGLAWLPAPISRLFGMLRRTTDGLDNSDPR